jgi:hypothetical protein
MDYTHASEASFADLLFRFFLQVKRLLKQYALFHLLFLTLIAVEFVALLLSFTLLVKSAWLALSLALFFLTVFVYSILRVYVQARRVEQMHFVIQRFVATAHQTMTLNMDVGNRYTFLSQACIKFADALEGKESTLYRMPKWLSFLDGFASSISRWLYKEDLHRARELLLQQAVAETIEWVKCEPVSLEAHAALANSYIALSGLYAHPHRQGQTEEDFKDFNKETIKSWETKFRAAARLAIEEFKIIQEFAPEDPWVHAQLAYSYHDLKMPAEEIKEYEILLSLDADDEETLFKLGTLYFEQGMNAQGLRTYESLLLINPSKAAELIKYYGNFSL